MAGVSETRTYDALLTTTLANYRKQLIDNIFDVYPFLSWLNGKLGRAMRGSTVKRTINGGESIVEHLLYEQNSTVDSYSGYEQLDVTPQEGMTIARYNWKQYSGSITISGLEERSNNGEAAMINLLRAKTTQTEMSLRDRMSRNAFGDGTGNGSKDMLGLAALVSTTATVGGLAPGTFAWWQSDVTTGAGSFAATGLAKMRTTFNNISFGNDKPDFLVTDQNVFEYYEAALQPQERYSNTTAANSGFLNLTFKNVPMLFDRDCTAGYLYMLNSRYMSFVVHGEADFSTGPFIKPENQDAKTANILWQGNLTTNNRRKLGVIQGFTA
jgi:hypothetical protein